ncbi:MAG TPA: pepsin/retropepsin-like aspartic protease family protein, partial [Bacteroidales bacterium]|nr:pepsin/retropepsin-like aspartic protease family protein [Bacteroidales bacterium]
MRLATDKHFILTFLILFLFLPGRAMSHCFSLREDPLLISLSLPSFNGIRDNECIWTGSGNSITIPLRRAGNIFLIEAEVDGERGYLVLDTGASGVVLNRTYFRDHVVMDSQTAGGVTGSVAEVEKIGVDQIIISGLKFKGLIADLANLGHIENRRGVKILGLIGFALIRNFEIVLDAGQSDLQLFKIDKKGERIDLSAPSFVSDYKCPFDEKNNILFLNTSLKGKRMNFCFDTGAETNVIDRDAPRSVLASVSITRRSTLNGAAETTTDVLFGTMNDFQFGEKTLDNLETIITNLNPLSESYGVRIDGMLGYSFFSRGVICINFVKKEFSISYIKA